MADGFNATLKMHGWAEILKAMHVLGDKMQQRQAAEEDLLLAAIPIVEAAKVYAPRDPGGRPGFGADTIHAVAEQPRNEREIARVAIGPAPSAWYLRFSELGTSKMPAHPFLRPALDTRLSDAMGILAQRLSARIREAWPRSRARG